VNVLSDGTSVRRILREIHGFPAAHARRPAVDGWRPAEPPDVDACGPTTTAAVAPAAITSEISPRSPARPQRHEKWRASAEHLFALSGAESEQQSREERSRCSLDAHRRSYMPRRRTRRPASAPTARIAKNHSGAATPTATITKGRSDGSAICAVK
jgi:hypothetical protein